MIPTTQLGGVGLINCQPLITDPYWSSVVLLLRGEGAEGGTVFVDSSPAGRTISMTSGYKTTAADYKFGASSIYNAVDGGWMSTTNTSATELTGDFTIEAWMKWKSMVGVDRYIIGWAGLGGIWWNADGDKKLRMGEDQYAPIEIVGTTTVGLDTWYHVALTRSGTTVTLWLDGASEGSYSSSSTFLANGTGLYIMAAKDSGGFSKGYLDNLRITKGACRYTGTFTPPTSDF